MTHIPDLDICNYFPFPHKGKLLAVGWLSSKYSFKVGKISESTFRHIEKLNIEPFQPIISMGLHTCELCQFDGVKGNRNLFIPSDENIIVAPELILHYIGCHGYAPPDRFLISCLKIDRLNGNEYYKLLLKNKGSFLLNKPAQQGDAPETSAI